MMSAIRHWLGIGQGREIDPELEEAKHALDYERGLYRQVLQRMDVNSRNLMKTWESAGDMMRSHGDQGE